MAVKIHVDSKDFERFMSYLPANMQTYVNEANFNWAELAKMSMRNELLNDSALTMDRVAARNTIVARKIGKNSAGVFMSKNLFFLDVMRPHYVSLKRGRRISAWASRYFGTATVSGMSRVYLGKLGGLHGAVYVTKHPFVDRALLKVRNQLPNELRKGIHKAYKASRR